MMAVLRILLPLLVMFSLGNAKADRCPYGWTNFGVRCYKFFPEKLDWTSAEKNCESLGANLASIHSKPEDEFLLSLIPAATPPSSCWVGGHDGEKEGQWLWSDGSPHDFSSWCSGQPDNSGGAENCGELNWGGQRCWNDGACSFELSYICATDL